MFASTFLVSAHLRTKRVRTAVAGVLTACLVVAGSMAYEVRRGDTLSAIAAQYGVSVSALVEANNIANPDLIRIGQNIVIPGQGGATETVHVVARGETLDRIARSYETKSSDIAKLNDLANPNLLQIGQKLRIPGGGTSGPTASFHVVAAGDTLSSIASRYGITVSQLAEANGITNTSTIYVGTRLNLSGTTTVVAETTAAAGTHTVVAGDTLGTIAAKYGTTVSEIAAANGIQNINSIRIGQQLTVPGGGTWVCPVPGASYVNDWGFPRSGGRFHQGNDLFAPRGTEVRAPVNGRVQVLTGPVGGLQFRLYGDDGVTYIGSHMEAFGRSGQVTAGEVIGSVGDSGNAVGAPTHLHFEIHPGDGDAVNPFPTLQKAGC